MLKVYLTDAEWAYDGVCQKVGELRGIKSNNEKLWTMLGALMLELLSSNCQEVTVYNDTRLVEEWTEQVKFESVVSRNIAVKLKNDIVKKFFKFNIEKLSRHAIESEIKNLQLI
jgi:hypothetical protein